MERLQRKGFTTYLVGGCVRDLLAGIHPKDFDIVTTAHPEDVRAIIPRAFIIGKRFRLVLVRRGEKQFEVATFRREARPEEIPEEFTTNDNVFGTPEQDATRRDFTLNGLFYDPVGDELIDYCQGLPDIEHGIIRMIGDPNVRLKEDPIRILRALRLAHKLHFMIEPSLRQAMSDNAAELQRSVLPRRREEILKILKLHDPLPALYEAHDLGILKHVAPTLDKVFENPEQCEVFENYIHRIHSAEHEPETPVELFGSLILAYFRAVISSDPVDPLFSRELLNDAEVKRFFRDELGMSNHEQMMVSKALQFQSILKAVDRIKKRGERRRMAVIGHEAFPLALMYAKYDHALDAHELGYWQTAFDAMKPRLEEQSEERGDRGGRRPRRGGRSRRGGRGRRRGPRGEQRRQEPAE
ncbi:MAG TPA: CCA tRNA nucleotidyltransferase [Bdellovibrionales bacterium]|nr:CCA tRNA nucleotidyltransferase [Bdellovibrionales bacterium]